MPETPLFEYTLSPTTVYITKDPNNPSIARLDIGVANHTGSNIECDWTSFAVIQGAGSGALTADPGAITSSSSCPDEWSITPINGAPGQFRAEPVFPNTGLKAGQSISFRLDNIIVNGALGGTRLEVIELVGERREKPFPINKIRGDLNIKFFRAQPTDIRPGCMARLSWKTVSAARCILSWPTGSDDKIPVTGSKDVQPSDTTIYTLTAHGGLGPDVSALTAVVVNRVKIIVFRGPTVRIRPGREAELLWRTESATKCELKADGVMVDANAPVRADPTPFLVYPKKDQTVYTLFAYDALGEYVQSQVTVFLSPKFNLSLRETWTEGVPSNMTYIATPSALLDDTRLFAASSRSDRQGTEGEFCVLDSSSRKRIFSRKNPGPREDHYYFLESSPDGKRLLTQSSMAVGMLDATPNSNYEALAVKDEVCFPGGAAFHPDGTKVYFAVGMSEPHMVLVCANTGDLSIAWTHPWETWTFPGGTSISPDGKTLCLVEMVSGRDLYLIDIASKQVTTISIGDSSVGPFRIVSSVWSPDGTKVYATNRTPGTIWVVKVATKEVTRISLGADIMPALLRLGPAIPDFEDGSNVLYSLCAPDGTVVGISTDTDEELNRLSLGQGSNPLFAFMGTVQTIAQWPRMAIAPDGKTIFVSNPSHSSIFMLDNGAQHQQMMAFREGVELEETVFDYIVTPNSVYITRDPHNPSIARLDIGVTNNTGSDKECDWTSFVVIPGEGSGALTADPDAISASSSRPAEWSITPINGAPGQFRAEPVFPNNGLKAGESISFRLDNIIVNGELGGTRLEVIELVGEPRQKAHPINKIRSDLNIDFFRSQPSNIRPGSSARLSWKTVSATKCILSWSTGSEVVPVTGSKDVQPSGTTIYTLTAQGGLGPDVPAQTAIVVNRVIISLEAKPIAVGLDGSSVLTWHVLNSDPETCRLNPGDLPIDAAGQKLVTLNKTTHYTISASAGNSTEFKQVTVSVERPTIRFFRATTPVKFGDPVTLSWEVLYAKAVFIDQGVGQVPLFGSAVVSDVNETTYTMTCLGRGEPVKASVTVPGKRVRILSLSSICLEDWWNCGRGGRIRQHTACVWDVEHATSTKLIRVSDNVVVATELLQFQFDTWPPAHGPEIEYKLVAEGPLGPAVKTIMLGWVH